MRGLRTYVRAALLATLLSPGFASLVKADPVADFYAGKTVTIAVGTTAGGTYDLYARAIARYLGKYLPGSPRVIVQNMPGAASYSAASYVFSVAPQDGTVIGAIAAALPYQPLIDPNSPKLDVPRINWLSSVSTFDVLMAVRSDLPINSVDDLRKTQTIMATIAPGQLPSLLVAATNETLGTKIKAINGHPSMNDAMVALQRGEIDGYPAIPVDAIKRPYADMKSKLRVLLQYGPAPSPEYPEAAYAVDLAKTPEDRMLLDLAQAPLKIGYIYMAGPKVPKERLAALRAALDATYKDPDFLADADRQVLNVAPVDGETITKLIADAYKTPPAVVERMRGLYRHLFE